MRRKLPPFAATRAFEATARHGSMQSASEELLLTSSAISHQVKALESFIGAALFERAPGRLTLTPTGQQYLHDLQIALDQLEAATARASGRGETNHLTVHMYHSLAELWFVPLLNDFRQEHPDIEISVISEPGAGEFAKGVSDIAIVYERIEVGHEAEFLFRDTIVPCCSEEFLARHGPIRTPEDLLQHQLIWCDTEPEEWPLWFRHASLGESDPQRWIAFDVRASVLHAAREGVGIAMGRAPYIGPGFALPGLVKAIDLGASTGFGYRLAVPARTKHLAKVKAFAHWLTDACHARMPELCPPAP